MRNISALILAVLAGLVGLVLSKGLSLWLFPNSYDFIEARALLRMGDAFLFALPFLMGAAVAAISLLRSRKSSQLIARAPGAKLLHLAVFAFSKKTFTRVFEPIISDLQLEYFEALSGGEIWKARMIWVRGMLAFWTAIGALAGVSAVKLVQKIWTAAS